MFLRIDLSIDVFFQFIVKISCSKHVVVAFNFSKKDPITRLALSRSLKKRVGQRRFAENVLYLW